MRLYADDSHLHHNPSVTSWSWSPYQSLAARGPDKIPTFPKIRNWRLPYLVEAVEQFKNGWGFSSSTTQWPLYRKPCEDDDLRAWQCKLDLIQSQARWGVRNLTSHPHRDHTPPSWMVNSPPLPFPLSCYKETDTVTQTQAHIYMLSHRYTNTQSYL